jgi:Zn ribbon nucleic-acid-binding protein
VTVPNCPFCDSESCLLTRYDSWHRCECPDCGAHGPGFGDETQTQDERDAQALYAWGSMAVRKR